eukprot:CAMPEP_0116964848 /NCGR_PEP_ID=MMETSP0467-20121206/48841_1 /TAXON_ID=283647 /ORGANISM="Mesodinium pulex, Strain SPMC105" /LENGTH=89 /DNA_ID=CAMNT_0004653927 /DNA_START=107 /DNA_END=372 /DNA_ORIENTATION=-
MNIYTCRPLSLMRAIGGFCARFGTKKWQEHLCSRSFGCAAEGTLQQRELYSSLCSFLIALRANSRQTEQPSAEGTLQPPAGPRIQSALP